MGISLRLNPRPITRPANVQRRCARNSTAKARTRATAPSKTWMAMAPIATTATAKAVTAANGRSRPVQIRAAAAPVTTAVIAPITTISTANQWWYVASVP